MGGGCSQALSGQTREEDADDQAREEDAAYVCILLVHRYTMSNQAHNLWVRPCERAGDAAVMLAASHALAQSTKLALYEQRTARLVEQTEYIPGQMARDGEVSLSMHGGYSESALDGQIDVREGEGKCSYRRADSIRDRRPTADHRISIHPELANVDLAVYGDMAVGRVLILNNPRAWLDPTWG